MDKEKLINALYVQHAIEWAKTNQLRSKRLIKIRKAIKLIKDINFIK